MANGTTATAGSGNFLSELLNNPLFFQALGAAAQGLDPEGIGGALGTFGRQAIEQEQARKALEQQRQEDRDLFSLLIQALGGGITPQGEAGVTSIKRTPTGAIVDLDFPVSELGPTSIENNPSPGLTSSQRFVPSPQGGQTPGRQASNFDILSVLPL